MDVNKQTYKKLIEEDIKWLSENTKHNLEYSHIIEVLKDSIDRIYGKNL